MQECGVTGSTVLHHWSFHPFHFYRTVYTSIYQPTDSYNFHKYSCLKGWNRFQVRRPQESRRTNFSRSHPSWCRSSLIFQLNVFCSENAEYSFTPLKAVVFSDKLKMCRKCAKTECATEKNNRNTSEIYLHNITSEWITQLQLKTNKTIWVVTFVSMISSHIRHSEIPGKTESTFKIHHKTCKFNICLSGSFIRHFQLLGLHQL